MKWQVEQKGQEVIDKLIIQSNLTKKKDRAMEKLYWRAKLKQDFDIKA